MKKEIYNLIKKSPYKERSLKNLAKSLHLISKSDFQELTRSLDQLTKENKIYRDKSGKYNIKQQKEDLLRGKLDLKANGYGFIIVEDSEMPDIYIAKSNINTAMDGDLCLVEITNKKTKEKIEGKIVEVIERKIAYVVGEYYNGQIFPKDHHDDFSFKLIREDQKHVQNHQLIKAKIINYKHPFFKNCELIEVIGHIEDEGIETLEVIHKYNLINQFSPEEILAAKNTNSEVMEEELKGRVDLRKETIFTIDSESTKDIDDAVSIKKKNDNYVLGVHIADVSHYIKEDSVLDKAAFNRGTSVYLADSVIPMLPRELSNGICSLNPQVDRLTLSCEMEITKAGEVVKYKIFPSVIKSKYKMTYTNINKMLDGDQEVIQEFNDIYNDVLLMHELQMILFDIREAMGSIDFETLEPKLIFDESGKLDDIVIRDRQNGERLIEEFMLVANQVVATHIFNMNLPFIYRIHELPNAEKLEHVFEFVKKLGYDGLEGDYSQENLQHLLKEVENTTYDKVVTTLLLRSMSKARYSRENKGHYGLAFDNYTHFTSPIRRYPDLIVHRNLRKYLFNNDKFYNQDTIVKLDEIAKQTSETERVAMNAEREILDIKKAEYMEKHINEEYVGVISSVLKFGMFVELPNTIEGLVHVSTLDDYYAYDENNLTLKAESSDKVYHIGQEVKVKVTKVNRLLGKIDFVIVKE
jgi:ribonuclease R